MIAPERLCLTADERLVVSAADPRAKFLLCPSGQIIPEKFEPLVRQYLDAQKEKELPKTEEAFLASIANTTDPIENRETRIPKNLRRRAGRPRKQNPSQGESPLPG